MQSFIYQSSEELLRQIISEDDKRRSGRYSVIDHILFTGIGHTDITLK